MATSKSAAITNLSYTLGMVAALLKLESSYRDPPRSAEAQAVEGLRAACAVLVVAGFEEFLKTCFRTELERLDEAGPQFDLLPEKLQVESVFKQLELALEAPGKKLERIPAIRAAADRVARQRLHPDSLARTNANPNPDVVNQLFTAIGFEK